MPEFLLALEHGELFVLTQMLLGPCMVAAPVVAVAGILLLPLWPLAILLVGLLRLAVFPMAWIARRAGMAWGHTVSGQLATAFRLVLRPWTYFTPAGESPEGSALEEED